MRHSARNSPDLAWLTAVFAALLLAACVPAMFLALELAGPLRGDADSQSVASERLTVIHKRPYRAWSDDYAWTGKIPCEPGLSGRTSCAPVVPKDNGIDI